MFSNKKPSLELARQFDAADPLATFKQEFLPPGTGGTPDIYFLGNSLGLQPRRTREEINKVLDDWATLGVESFFHASEPWMNYHETLQRSLSTIVGAYPDEVVVMNQLTVNLHLMMVSFYQPQGKRRRILCEAKAFPSDQYALETHLRYRQQQPEESILEIAPRAGEHLLRTEDILQAIEDHADEVALILLGGLHYYTGQVLDMKAIAQFAREKGITIGFDLAHAAGNIPLQLHDWGVDFACWCNYKYLNAGPGAMGAAFIHRRHHASQLPRFAGWWGYDEATRFKMEKGFLPMAGAAGWQLSTPAILLYATLRASLQVFEEAGWEKIQEKRKSLNEFLWAVLQDAIGEPDPSVLEILTPTDPAARGCQVSMLVHRNGRSMFDAFTKAGIRTDWREPNVIRLAPVPLYNSYEEVYQFGEIFKSVFQR
jgi:kynureninase